MDLFDVRKDYRQGHLEKDDIAPNPLHQLERWVQEAEASNCLEHSAVNLSTVNEDGGVSSRIVLLKKMDDEGLYIFTNYNSRKGQHLAANDKAAMLFFWPELERQVNVEGRVEKCSPELSAAYFNQRPLESRVSAVVSRQSVEVPDREAMESPWHSALAIAKQDGITCPSYWGGYILRPHRIEFWQGGANRFHDRILCEQSPSGWSMKRLMP